MAAPGPGHLPAPRVRALDHHALPRLFEAHGLLKLAEYDLARHSGWLLRAADIYLLGDLRVVNIYWVICSLRKSLFYFNYLKFY